MYATYLFFKPRHILLALHAGHIQVHVDTRVGSGIARPCMGHIPIKQQDGTDWHEHGHITTEHRIVNIQASTRLQPQDTCGGGGRRKPGSKRC